MKNIRLFLLLPALILFLGGSCSRQQPEPYVVMLSLDGFRWDYAERVPTPNLDRMRAQGVYAEVIPAFPTKTFPNHYSMATGLYPGNHGIVSNNFYCPTLNMSYRLGDRESVENGIFYHGEPIWVTAGKQGLTSASFFWVGSEAPVQGMHPTYWKPYDNAFPYEARIDTVIAWLSLPREQRPRLVTFYYNQPDSHGHTYGPDSPEVDQQVMYLDSLVGVLQQRLAQLPIARQINLIVTSDHGMTPQSADRYIDLTQHVQRDWFEKIQGGNPLWSLMPKEGMLDSVFTILQGVENISTWKRGQIPERFHYNNNPRVLDMVVLADSSWSVSWGQPGPGILSGGGAHGWDNLQLDMRTVFWATGPNFRENHQHSKIEVVDLYPMIAHILRLKPAQVDGKLERVKGMMR